MKKLVAKTKHKKTCIRCNCNFNKGDIYYNDRVYFGNGYSYTFKYCPRCKYKEEQQRIRFENYKKKCKHPKVATKWRMYEPGQYEPDYEYCLICDEILD